MIQLTDGFGKDVSLNDIVAWKSKGYGSFRLGRVNKVIWSYNGLSLIVRPITPTKTKFYRLLRIKDFVKYA